MKSAWMFIFFLYSVFAVHAARGGRTRSRSGSRAESPERSGQSGGSLGNLVDYRSSEDSTFQPDEGNDDGEGRSRLSMSLRRRPSVNHPEEREFSPSSYMMAMGPQYPPGAQYFTYMPVQQNHHHHGQAMTTGAKVLSVLQIALRIGILIMFGYAMFLGGQAIQQDMVDRVAAEQAKLGGQISLCKSNFETNNCKNPVELTKSQCQEWEICMSGSPAETGTRMEAFVFALGSVFQKFLAAFTWDTKFFLLFAIIMIAHVFKNSFGWLLGSGSNSAAPMPQPCNPMQYAAQPVVYQPAYPALPPPTRYLSGRRNSRDRSRSPQHRRPLAIGHRHED